MLFHISNASYNEFNFLLVIPKAHVVNLYVYNFVFLVHKTHRMHNRWHVTVRVYCCNGVGLPNINSSSVIYVLLLLPILIFHTIRLVTLIDPSSVTSTETPFLNWNDIVPCSVLLTMSPQLLFFNFYNRWKRMIYY